MKLGTISWTFGLDDLDELFSAVRKTGFNYLQFCGDHKKYNPTDVVAASEQYGVELLSYDPFNCRPPNDGYAHLEPSISRYKDILQFAVDLGVPMVTLQGLSTWTVNQPTYEAAMQQIIEAIRQLNEIAKQHNLTLTYEACNHYELPWIQTADELLRLKSESGATQLQFVLDSFHMHIAEKNMIEPIQKIGGTLLHSYHVSDSGRGGVGTGQIDFIQQFNTLKSVGFTGPVFFEIVIPSVRPYKFPMNAQQLQEFMEHSGRSLQFWDAIR